jgi:outer membrane protein assembly factor BamA
MPKIISAILLLAIFALPGFAENAETPSANENVITKIVITGNRIKESVIRKNLAFREGDVVDDVKIEKSRANLYALGIFKTLNITRERDESTGCAKIVIDAHDGWYVLPIPMFGNSGGERYLAGTILEQNAFKEGERVSASGGFSDSLSHYSLSTQMNRVTFSGSLDRRSYTEYQYQDGAFNSQILTGRNTDTLGNYGVVVSSYDRDETDLNFSAGMPLSEHWRGTAGVSFDDIQYSNVMGVPPNDGGRINTLNLGVQYNSRNNYGNGGRDMAGAVGRILGLGMADYKENFKPLPRTTIDYGFQASVENSNRALGSDDEFSKMSLSGSRAVNYTDRSRLSLSVKTGYGYNLPFSELFATDRSDGLMGVYAREFRGEEIATANVDYRRPLYRNTHGQFTGDVFAEYADCVFNGQQGQKEGVGFNVSFQSWRFPLPLGLGYTYSFDDRDWKVSTSFGGRF